VLLRLSPDIAGITLLAFASGAPDIFTELAAINGGAQVPPSLLLGAPQQPRSRNGSFYAWACIKSCQTSCPSGTAPMVCRLTLRPALRKSAFALNPGSLPPQYVLIRRIHVMVAAGNAVEVELAVSSVVGSGLFICSVSLAAVILVSPVEIKDRVAFVSRRAVPAGTPFRLLCNSAAFVQAAWLMMRLRLL
jgi:hypothetical protein